MTKERPLDSMIEDARLDVDVKRDKFQAAVKKLKELTDLRDGLSTVHPRDTTQ